MPTVKAPYGLHVPADTDLADVPQDFDTLATTMTAALNTKLDKSDKDAAAPADVPTNYQKRIKVQDRIPRVGDLGPGVVEGDFVFVYTP